MIVAGLGEKSTMTLSIVMRRSGVTALVGVLLAVLLTIQPSQAPEAAAQGITQEIEVWGINGSTQLANSKNWKFRQSFPGNDLGSASAADPDLDDSSWGIVPLRWTAFPGDRVANHFRKDFDLSDINIEPFQVLEINVELQYDDAAILYLNGTEVYRSIRGNLDPDYALYPLGADIPAEVVVRYGGAEDAYVQIPDPGGVNSCELPEVAPGEPSCPTSPYGGAQPPAIDPALLVEGTNTWAITTWNRYNPNSETEEGVAGSGDSSINHVFSLGIDQNALPPSRVFINEVMASNKTALEVELDGDPNPETPDWIELHNADDANAVSLAGWNISDASATWTFPASASIPAGGYLLVYANDEDIAIPPQTNFKLSSGGDSVKLVTSDGLIADEYTWTDQFDDNSMGRVSDFGEITYLAAPTPGQFNGVPRLTDAPPVLRYFRDRMYNPGELVELDFEAFDPDGDAVSFSMSPLPTGVSLEPTTGLLTGFANYNADVESTITVIDADGDSDTQNMTWFYVGTPAGPSPLVLNEYNAVPEDGELIGGSPIGNGGDWFEFLVVEDDVDLRGWSIEFRQRDSGSDELRIQTAATFNQSPSLGKVPAGTLITISEELPDDLSFDANNDWHINLGIDGSGNGSFFVAAGADDTFNSTRRDQTVLIRNAEGQVVTPLSGETDAWDSANGGVSEGEVMNLCVGPTQNTVIDPVADYRDNGLASTFGQPNVCLSADPNNPQALITTVQDLGPLRASAAFGAGSGDVNCDLVADVVDSLLITRYDVTILSDTGPCLLNRGGANQEIATSAGDVNRDGVTDVVDALIISSCGVGGLLQWCDGLAGAE